MPDSNQDSRRQTSPTSRHYDCNCQNCGKQQLAKAGATCNSCGGPLIASGEVTRKTFGADDNDLLK